MYHVEEQQEEREQGASTLQRFQSQCPGAIQARQSVASSTAANKQQLKFQNKKKKNAKVWVTIRSKAAQSIYRNTGPRRLTVLCR